MEESDPYSLENNLKWRETMSDGIVLFSNGQPSIKEREAKELNDKQFKFIELSEKDCIKNYGIGLAKKFSTGQMVFYPAKGAVCKVTKVTDWEDGSQDVSATHRDTDELFELNTEKDRIQMTISVDLKMMTNKGQETLNMDLRVAEKLDTEIGTPLSLAGITNTGFKYFYGGKELNKDLSILQVEGSISDGMTIIAVEGIGKPSVFRRIDKPHDSWSWYNSGSSADGLTFIPNQNIKVAGFSTWASKDSTSYDIKYKVCVGDQIVEEHQYNASEWEDEYYNRVWLHDLHDVSSGEKLEITVWIAQDLSSHSNVQTYYGYGCENYKEMDNEHKGLFTIEAARDSGNGTSMYSGHFPELFYHLC